jgi:hypothetical protein
MLLMQGFALGSSSHHLQPEKPKGGETWFGNNCNNSVQTFWYTMYIHLYKPFGTSQRIATIIGHISLGGSAATLSKLLQL